MKSLLDCWLYAFVDTAYLRGRAPEMMARELCEGGADIIQLRAKQSGRDEVRRLAEAILPVTREAGIPLVINDQLSVACEIGAEFCHLGQEDFFDAGYTRVFELPIRNSPTSTNASVRIGLSTHSSEQAARALAAGPDYIATGPIYQTATKPTAQPVTLDYVRWAAVNVTLPWFAIGGINLATLDGVLAAGAKRICVVSAILNSDDIAATCRQFKRRLDGTV
jgi:thiamine-phosphate pyrophosphorylase